MFIRIDVCNIVFPSVIFTTHKHRDSVFSWNFLQRTNALSDANQYSKNVFFSAVTVICLYVSAEGANSFCSFV